MADVYKGELAPLQRHVAFFDVTRTASSTPPRHTKPALSICVHAAPAAGFRAIGAGVPLSAFSALFINGLLGPKTIPENEKAPAFKLPIYVKNIQKGKHGSDSGVYDANGAVNKRFEETAGTNEGFVPEKFEAIFKKHAHTRPDALTGKELQELLKANREPKDFKGWLGGFTEWKVLYSLCKDEKGFLHKDTVRAVYDGSLFERLEERKSKESTNNK
ncbi:putative peroxygenase 5 [Panicum miliaceum]|uniref:Peroxygenase 5 n=1 Tax=Panicum miliaceum TaxID=4540 RepID=A0A3L6S049_PANMI|nr:putative peroxygenase 5 [Panicum miliaceum]